MPPYLPPSAILSRAAPHLRQPVASYFQSNIHITTSGYFTPQPFRCAQDVVSLDRLLISVDYPFSPNTRGRAFLDSLADMLNAEGLASLAHENAESLLRL
jgi:predicted TIM-barrel fold metal-dependent hydrolase